MAALLAFAKREGHARVPHGHLEGRVRLGAWVNQQRYRFKNGRLTPERIATLERLPGWVWDANQAAWEDGLSHLNVFVKREGHARVPLSHLEGEDAFALGRWVSQKRQSYHRRSLPTAWQRELSSLPGWTWDPFEDEWQRGLKALRSFAKRERHVVVARTHREDGFALGQWMALQRQAYRRGRLAVSRRKHLEQIPGWSWRPHEAGWQLGLARLAQFAEREGHARVPLDHRELGFDLGKWVNRQRHDFRNSRLSDSRKRELERTPGWVWLPYERKWEEGTARIAAFVREHGHARIPQTHVTAEGFQLGAWAKIQRGEYRRGKLRSDRQHFLEALPGWEWEPDKAKWRIGFENLVRFAKREGHAQVPAGHIEGAYPLGQWVTVQRQAFRKRTLGDDRARLLVGVPGWLWDPFEASWQEGRTSLERYVLREGHALVPQKHQEQGFPLGTWVARQRRNYLTGKLSDERLRFLRSVRGWVWRATL
jgi:hypothetical protein